MREIIKHNEFFHTIKIPSHKRLFYVGDIHGMFLELEKLLEKANFDKNNDILIATGDLIDRGTDSHLSIQYLNEPWFFTIYGNHEDLLMTEFKSESLYWKGNGGCWDPKENKYEDFAKAFAELPVVIETHFKNKKIGVVHAGVPNFIEDWAFFTERVAIDPRVGSAALWDRTRFNAAKSRRSNPVKNIDIVISGHSITTSILQDENSLFIDTGGFFLDEKFSGEWGSEQNRLTMIELLVNEDELTYKVF